MHRRATALNATEMHTEKWLKWQIFCYIHFVIIKKTKTKGDKGFPGGSVVKNLPASAGDAGSICESGSSPGEGNGNPFQYSCLENPMDRRGWRAIVHGVRKELDMV